VSKCRVQVANNCHAQPTVGFGQYAEHRASVLHSDKLIRVGHKLPDNMHRFQPTFWLPHTGCTLHGYLNHTCVHMYCVALTIVHTMLEWQPASLCCDGTCTGVRIWFTWHVPHTYRLVHAASRLGWLLPLSDRHDAAQQGPQSPRAVAGGVMRNAPMAAAAGVAMGAYMGLHPALPFVSVCCASMSWSNAATWGSP
jgi:hypothetical protein